MRSVCPGIIFLKFSGYTDICSCGRMKTAVYGSFFIQIAVFYRQRLQRGSGGVYGGFTGKSQ